MPYATSKVVRCLLASPLVSAIAALWILLLGAEEVRPCFFLHDDNATWFIGAYVHDFRVLTETGRLAEVNFYQYGGEPFLEQGQTAVLYPPVYMGVALAKWISGDLRWTIEWLAAGHLTLGLLGFYYWLRRGGVSPGLAALGGLAWVCNPFVLLVGASWIMVTYAAAWLPWLFWALDRLYDRPTRLSAFLLGTIAALFFLQGYVQWAVYAFFFLGLYALYRVWAPAQNGRVWRLAISYHLLFAAFVFLILVAPLLLPMFHAASASMARAKPFSLGLALGYRVQKSDLIHAQFCLFRPNMIFGMSTAILYCPTLLFLPVMLLRFYFIAAAAVRSRLFPLLILSLLALLFSSWWHFLLSLLPVFEKFRWPFKVFLFADFFLLASLVWTVSSWTTQGVSSPPRRRWAAPACLVVVLLASLTISLSFHDENMFSKTVLPTSKNSLPAGMETNLGRVLAIDTSIPETDGYRYFTHAHSTFFQVPSLGGYDPLVGREQLRFALGLDFPNLYSKPITPEIRQQLNALAVRYWIVDPHSPRLQEVLGLAGLRQLAAEPDRVIFENEQAASLAYSGNNPLTAIPVTYAGNSLRIPLSGFYSPVAVSVGPTDGWWYRIDRGPWLKPVDVDDRLRIEFPLASKQLEITYFDPRFRNGLRLSLYLLLLLGLLLPAGRLCQNPTMRSSATG